MKNEFKIGYEKLIEWIDPELVFRALFADYQRAFWLDSSMAGSPSSRFSYMGIPDETIVYSLAGNRLVVERGNKSEAFSQDIYTYLDEQLSQRKVRSENLPFDFSGGYIGYFGYELKALCGGRKSYESSYPDSLWYFVKQYVVFDHADKLVYLVALTDKNENDDSWFLSMKTEIGRITNRSLKLPRPHLLRGEMSFILDRGRRQYLKDITRCKKYLRSGESYEICLTNTVTTETGINPFQLYTKLRRANPAPYASYIRYGDVAILCSSPELFLRIDKNRWVESKPIKGTVKRGKTRKEDREFAEALTLSEKDRSENLMIVDLVRNDLGRVCEIGSVTVPKLMAIETYQTVHQMVSTVKGKLRADKSVIDCIRALFPGGSMTGAPKIRTMEILDRIERKARGIYSGSIGYLSLNQTVSLNIVIRTIVIQKNLLHIGTGGAILMPSVPEKEFEEMLLKGQILMETIAKATGASGYAVIGSEQVI